MRHCHSRLFLAALFATSCSFAATLTWSPAANSTGGSGTWDATTPNFFDGSSQVPFSTAVSVTLPGSGSILFSIPKLTIAGDLTIDSYNISPQPNLSDSGITVSGTTRILNQTTINPQLTSKGTLIVSGSLSAAYIRTESAIISGSTFTTYGFDALSLTLTNNANITSNSQIFTPFLSADPGTVINTAVDGELYVLSGTDSGKVLGLIAKDGPDTFSMPNGNFSNVTVYSGTFSTGGQPNTTSTGTRFIFLSVAAGATFDVTAVPGGLVTNARISGAGSILGNITLINTRNLLSNGLLLADGNFSTLHFFNDLHINGIQKTDLDFDINSSNQSDLLQIDGSLTISPAGAQIRLAQNGDLPAATYTFPLIQYGEFSAPLNDPTGLSLTPIPGFDATLINDPTTHLIEALLSPIPDPANAPLLLLPTLTLLARRRRQAR